MCYFYKEDGTIKIYMRAFFHYTIEWSEHDVVEKYLRPIGMEHLAKEFMENRISGAVLMALEVRERE